MNQQNKQRLKFGAIAVAIIGTILASLALVSQSTYATIDQTIVKKAIGYAVSQCYKNGAMNSPITAETYDDNWGQQSLVGYGGGSHSLPTGAYNGVYSLSCSELLNGNGVNGAFPGAYSIAGVTPPSSASNTTTFDNFMTSMGYTKHAASGGGQCASFTYASGSDTDVTKICAETDSQGRITGGVSYQGSGLVFRMDVTDNSVKVICTQLFDSFATNSCSPVSYQTGSTSFTTLAGEIYSELLTHRANGFLGGSYKLVENVEYESRGNALAEYRIDNKTTAANKAARTLTGYTNSTLKLSANEQQALLQDYLLNFYAVERFGNACNLSTDQANTAKSAGYSEVETSMYGAGRQKCWIRATKNTSSSVAGYNSEGYFDGTPMDYDAVIKALGGSVSDMRADDKKKCNDAATMARQSAQALLNASTTSDEYRQRANTTIASLDEIKNKYGEYWHEENGAIVCYPFTAIDGTTTETPTESTTTPDTPTTDSGNPDGNASALDGCFGNAGVLGWIICPVIKFVGETVGGIYDMIVENYLTMGAATVTDPAVNEAWSKFQGYANIIFAILLVFVILAQVTGIGLSNYGIKKVLPKLIITVILVNVSFILCAVAIDVSNIVGASLNDFLKGIDVGGLGASDFNLAVFATNTLTSLFSVGAAAGSITIAAYTITISGGWGMLLLPLLLALLTALIGIIFFFLLLGVRQAAIILLLVVSPLAIVCYALPNTKRFFDRWLKMFSALLLVYPICGLMMGGGNLASRILLTAGSNAGFMYFLVAMLVQVVPFFLIPGVLKNSMTALGGMGAKIAGMGDRLSGWATRSIRNSRGYQDYQQEALRNSNMTRDGRIARSYKKTVQDLEAKEKAGTITQRERQQLSRARYRLNRASSRYERGVMEDLNASVNAQRDLLEPGSERYNTTRDRLVRRQASEEARGLTELYDAGTASKIDGSGKLDVSDEAAVVDEFDAILDRLDANPEDNDALAKMQALSNSMMGKGEFGENAIRAALERHVAKQIRGGRMTAAANNGLRQMSNHISSGPLGGRLKADDRDTFDMATSLAKGEKYYNDPDGFAKDFGIDATTGNLVHNKFGRGSAGKLSARGLADSNDAVLDRIQAAVQSGDIQGAELNTLMKNVDEALNNDTIQLKTGVRQKLESIAHQAYTKSSGSVATRTANATSASIMASSSTKTLDAMLSRVQNYANLQPAEQAAQEDELRVMAENAKYALENNIVKDTATAERLQDIVKTVRAQGISDFAGNTGNNSFKLNSGSFKIRGAAQAERHADVPAGWISVTGAPGGYRIQESPGVYRDLNAQELEHLKELRAFNRQVDMRNSSKGLDGGSGTP